jgi:hypothetical protein
MILNPGSPRHIHGTELRGAQLASLPWSVGALRDQRQDRASAGDLGAAGRGRQLYVIQYSITKMSGIVCSGFQVQGVDYERRIIRLDYASEAQVFGKFAHACVVERGPMH